MLIVLGNWMIGEYVKLLDILRFVIVTTQDQEQEIQAEASALQTLTLELKTRRAKLEIQKASHLSLVKQRASLETKLSELLTNQNLSPSSAPSAFDMCVFDMSQITSQKEVSKKRPHEMISETIPRKIPSRSLEQIIRLLDHGQQEPGTESAISVKRWRKALNPNRSEQVYGTAVGIYRCRVRESDQEFASCSSCVRYDDQNEKFKWNYFCASRYGK